MDYSDLTSTGFIDVAHYLIELPATASAVQINRVYWSVRAELEYLIDNTDNASVYAPAWQLVGVQAQQDLRDYLSGNDMALEQLKRNVAESIRVLP
ncbi:hypothetical protein [Spirosoma gilvum]